MKDKSVLSWTYGGPFWSKLPHRSVFSATATVVLFISLLCIFIGGKIRSGYECIFSLVLQFIFDCTANYFLLLVLRIIFSLALRIIFHGSVNLFLAYNTLRACD